MLAVTLCCISSLGDEVLAPVIPEGAATPQDEEAGGEGVPTVPQEPTVPGDGSVPEVPTDPDGDDSRISPVETIPPKGDSPFEPLLPGNPLLLFLLLMVFGALAAYVPGEVRRIRIETALQESMDARLALARGEFVVALAGFDRAIEQAHRAYTRRHRVQGTAEWVLLPDHFYIGLWRGRAAALMGLGRVKTAVATQRLANEMESIVDNGRK
jgi:hypothetical protein